MAAVRYIVSDIPESVKFYRDTLDFSVKMETDGFAALSHDDLILFLNVPGIGSAGKAGGNPEPGGWSRFQIETNDLDRLIDRLKSRNVSFRGGIAEGPGGRQILLEDPSGNVVELFEHAKAASEHAEESPATIEPVEG
jgi:catechol 2,3-dioxygenase-like lactoylglutathione lyase family enzyme